MDPVQFGYVRVAGIVPVVDVANPPANVRTMLDMARKAMTDRPHIVVFPELGLTGYTCGDLFGQDVLLKCALKALREFVNATTRLPYLDTVFIVSLPLAVGTALYNCSVACANGKILAVYPKTDLPGYKEFYEPRWFAPAAQLKEREMLLIEQRVPVGPDILLNIQIERAKPVGSEDQGPLTAVVGVEICEAGWMPIPPSAHQALHGATILLNASASNSVVAKADYRKELFGSQSARCMAAEVYVSAGPGESTSDVVFDGHQFIYENGSLLAESERFATDGSIIMTDIDVEKLARERRTQNSFAANAAQNDKPFRTVDCRLTHRPAQVEKFFRRVDKDVFVPAKGPRLDERCEDVFAHQVHGLVHRIKKLGLKQVVIGVSGGLDSTLALLVAVRAFDMLGLDRKGIIAITMPGPGTGDRTYANAVALIKALGVTFKEISIVEAVTQHLKDIGHDPCWKCPICENAQARERTQILMDHGFVLGTGDLSEAALGWCTYNGDHMSMYNVNCGVPKTLVRFIVAWVAEKNLIPEASAILKDIVDTPISPELTKSDDGELQQKTEDLVGPYDLNDFFLFHTVRNGFAPRKIRFLATHGFTGIYDLMTINKWLGKFIHRFAAAQFKRDAVPNGPKIGSVSLSPRGDWRMPSDVDLAAWTQDFELVA